MVAGPEVLLVVAVAVLLLGPVLITLVLAVRDRVRRAWRQGTGRGR